MGSGAYGFGGPPGDVYQQQSYRNGTGWNGGQGSWQGACLRICKNGHFFVFALVGDQLTKFDPEVGLCLNQIGCLLAAFVRRGQLLSCFLFSYVGPHLVMALAHEFNLLFPDIDADDLHVSQAFSGAQLLTPCFS